MSSELDLNGPTDREGIVLSRYYITLLTKGNKDMWFISSCERKNGDKTFFKVRFIGSTSLEGAFFRLQCGRRMTGIK